MQESPEHSLLQQTPSELYDAVLVAPVYTNVRFPKGSEAVVTAPSGETTAYLTGLGLPGPAATVRFLQEAAVVITPSVLCDLAFVVETLVLQDKVGSLEIIQDSPDSFEVSIKEVDLDVNVTGTKVSHKLLAPFVGAIWDSLEAENEAREIREDDPFLHFSRLDPSQVERIRSGTSGRLSIASWYGRNAALSPTGVLPELHAGEFLPLGYQLYEQINEEYKIAIEKIARFDSAYRVSIPPLLAILLQRCKSQVDISSEIAGLRAEFADLRTEVAKLEKELLTAGTLGQQIQVMEEIEATRQFLTRKIAGRNSLTTSFIKRVWGFSEEMGLFKAWKGDFGDLLRWDERRILTNRIRGFLDLWQLAMNVEKHYPLLERVFGSNNIDDRSLSKFRDLALRSSQPVTGNV